MAPPHGLRSNFVDPPTMMSIAVAGTAVIHLVTIPFVLARAYVNVFVSKKLHIEDYLCYLSYTGCIAYTAAIVHAESIGMARHMWDIPLSTFTEILYICNIVFVCYTATGGLAKTMVFLQLKKIFTTGAYDAVFWVIVVSLVANAIFYTAMLFLYIFTCWPREKIWNSTVEGLCLDSNKLNMAMGTLNVISDMEAFAVPVWAIWHLSMELKRKIGVFAVFSVGAV
ncbi:hypothetical protein N0V95_008665 [Ascochyta clinopodiicola]|nr:hypothetical protein N0V95_008665 [Ascochyta clinopodiicola]